MSEVNESNAWRREFTGLLDEDIQKTNGYDYTSLGVAADIGDWKFQVAEFAKGAVEMSVEFGKRMRDVMKQTMFREDSVIMQKIRGPCDMILEKLGFLNEYLLEYRDLVHAWCMIFCVWIFAPAVSAELHHVNDDE